MLDIPPATYKVFHTRLTTILLLTFPTQQHPNHIPLQLLEAHKQWLLTAS